MFIALYKSDCTLTNTLQYQICLSFAGAGVRCSFGSGEEGLRCGSAAPGHRRLLGLAVARAGRELRGALQLRRSRQRAVGRAARAPDPHGGLPGAPNPGAGASAPLPSAHAA